jgi:Rrf2 family protein
VAYSTAFSQSISILLLINIKMEQFQLEFVSTKTISECLKIPAPTVVKILKNLNEAGIIATKEGAKGGVLLIRSIEEITLLDIFLAIEHETPLFKTQIDFFVENQQVDDVRSKITNCLQDAEKAMKESLKKTTLADLY